MTTVRILIISSPTIPRLVSMESFTQCNIADCEEAFECFEDLLDDNKIDCGDDE